MSAARGRAFAEGAAAAAPAGSWPDGSVVGAIETRTSSPIRIKRREDGQSLNTDGLFPAGEGAGYAGGILSAGIDGIKAAESVALNILKENY